jgi:hypothetical protein
VSSSILDQVVRYDEPSGDRGRRKRRVLYNVTALVLTAIVLTALLESLANFPLFGMDARVVHASSATTDLEVSYPRVARGQLDTDLTIRVHRSGGFSGPVTVEISADYLGMFTNQRPSPQPLSQSHDERIVSSTFDPPRGDTLVIDWSLGARPRAWFASVVGSAIVLGDDGQTDVSVSFRTDVRP